MSREQIEEMARTVCGEKENTCKECNSGKTCEFWIEASILYSAGYRKQSGDCKNCNDHEETESERINEERTEIAQTIADNFGYMDEKYDASDFEWAALQVQLKGYRKQSEGEWIQQPIPYEDEIVCTVCGANFNVIDNCTEKFNYCPNCGAEMRKEDEGK